MIYTFHHLELDSQLYELRKYGRPIRLEPQVFNLLFYLIKHRDRIVSKQELLEELWEKRVVSESTLNTCIKTARKAVGDDGRAQKIISTIYRRGYRFVADVEENGCVGNNTQKKRIEITAMSLEQRPSISITPLLHNLKMEDSVWLTEIVTKEINRYLANIPSYIVTYSHTLPTDYVLSGSVRKIESHFKISLQLLEIATGQFLWANHQTLAATTLYSEREETTLKTIVRSFIVQIEPVLNRAELVHLNNKPIVGLDSWALCRKANALLAQKGWNNETFAYVSLLLDKATKVKPASSFVRSYAQAHFAFFLSVSRLIGLNRECFWKKKAVRAAETAIELDSQNSHVLGDVGCTLAVTGEYERGKHLIQHALTLNGNNANAWASLGTIKLKYHDESGLADLRQGIAMSPCDNRIAAWGALLSYGLLRLRRVDEAIQVANQACQCDDKILLPRIVSTLAYCTIGYHDKALLAWQDVLRVSPRIDRQAIDKLTNKKEIQQLQALNVL